MPRLIDLSGKRFGRLQVIRRAGTHECGLPTWLCRCDCGSEKEILGQNLRLGESNSCGCLQRELMGERSSARFAEHGESTATKKTPEYVSWSAMLSRCNNPNATGYERYGGVGITVCQRWRESYQHFLADMGRRPSKQHSLDRFPNNAGNYEPDNCRWATKSEQSSNQRKRRSR